MCSFLTAALGLDGQKSLKDGINEVVVNPGMFVAPRRMIPGVLWTTLPSIIQASQVRHEAVLSQKHPGWFPGRLRLVAHGETRILGLFSEPAQHSVAEPKKVEMFWDAEVMECCFLPLCPLLEAVEQLK